MEQESLNKQTTTIKPIKRTRVSRACDFCRRKKIKCDIDQKVPCSSCTQYRWDCTSSDGPRKRKPPKGYIESLEMRLKDMEQLLLQKQLLPHKTKGLNSLSLHQLDSENEMMIRHIGSSSPYYVMGKEQLRQQSPSSHSYATRKVNQGMLTLPLEQGELQLMYDDDDNDLMVIHQRPTSSLQSQLDTDGGIGSIISGSLVKTLTKRFFELRPAIIPALDEESFTASTKEQTANTLLISSMCSYVCMVLPKGDPVFNNLDRKKLIQDLATNENDLLKTAFLLPTISNIQAIILLCCHPTHISLFTGIWLRVGIAIRMSQDLGLHRTLTTTSYSQKTHELGKRLWYCVYILDRWSCAVLGRPLAIVDADCNVELPRYQPRENQNVERSQLDDINDNDNEIDHSYFIQFIKLSGILGEIQRRVYSPKAKANLGVSSIATSRMVDSLHKLLLGWFDQLPPDARVSKEDIDLLRSLSSHKEQKAALLQSRKWKLGAPMMICYHAVCILLHRPFIIPDNELLFSQASANQCTESAIAATDIARLLEASNYVHFYWNILVFALSVVVSIHLFNCSNDQKEVSKTAYQYTKISIEDIWNKLELNFPFAPKPVSITPIQYVIMLLGLKELLPAQLKSSSSSTPSTSTPASTPTPTSASTSKSATLVNAPSPCGVVGDSNDIVSAHDQPSTSASNQTDQYLPPFDINDDKLNSNDNDEELLRQLIASHLTDSTESIYYPAFNDGSSSFTTPDNGLPNSNSSTVNPVLNQDMWQQIFLNNMEQTPLTTMNKEGDDFWQGNFSLF